jgi:hypothetical protein
MGTTIGVAVPRQARLHGVVEPQFERPLLDVELLHIECLGHGGQGKEHRNEFGD